MEICYICHEKIPTDESNGATVIENTMPVEVKYWHFDCEFKGQFEEQLKNMDTQVKNSFDKESIKKIVRSLIYCLTSAIGAGLVAYSQTKNIESSILISLGAFGTLILTITKEYTAGV